MRHFSPGICNQYYATQLSTYYQHVHFAFLFSSNFQLIVFCFHQGGLSWVPGCGVQALLSRWQTEEWNFKIHYQDLKQFPILVENTTLKCENQTLKAQLAEMKKQRDSTERMLAAALKKLNRAQNLNSNVVKQKALLSQKLVHKSKELLMLKTHGNLGIKEKRLSVKRKIWHQYSVRHRYRLRKSIPSDCVVSLDFLGMYGFQATKVDIRNSVTGKIETVQLVPNQCMYTSTTETQTTSDVDKLLMTLWAKEKYSVSDQAYKELSAIEPNMPRLYTVHQRIKQVNEQWSIKEMPGSIPGYQVDLKQLLVQKN